MNMEQAFDRFSAAVSAALGRPWAFIAAMGSIAVWAAAGPYFNYSNLWQLVINTGTTVVSFLMLFLLQSSTTRQNAAMAAKLDELIRAIPEARDELIAIEEKALKDIKEMRNPLKT